MTQSIADTLHDAIELRLWDGVEPKRSGTCQFSCVAVSESYSNPAVDFLHTLGWPYNHGDFMEFRFGERRQYARALALTFAELIAREENL